jgi:hypothetical protein
MFDNGNIALGDPGSVECVLDTTDQKLGIRDDFRGVIVDGYREYLETFSKWTNSRLGLQFSTQPGYNLPMDMASVIPYVDAPECESLGFSGSIDAYRRFTGSSNLVGARVISNEMGAVFERAYSYTIPELLFSFDRAVVNGINQVILHRRIHLALHNSSCRPSVRQWRGRLPSRYSEPTA